MADNKQPIVENDSDAETRAVATPSPAPSRYPRPTRSSRRATPQSKSRTTASRQTSGGQTGRPLPPRAHRRGTARARRDSGLYLPLWSLALMLFLVMLTVAGIIILIIGLGGKTTPENAPVILIVHSPAPTTRPATFPISPATPTIPPYAQIIMNRHPVVTLALTGPTLPPQQITATPRRIAIGESIIVVDVGTQQLNVRDNAGVIGTSIIFLAPEGTIFTVIDGPLQVDGLLWWKIQNPNDPSQTGWAASNYLRVAPE